ncbi:alkyl sulfatase C-terminal domain-containing protein [Nonomuraea phyllanthi]|nr:alkyl sulfatase C-terminal domain-containing protein [Nonomuraea phyllanthi]
MVAGGREGVLSFARRYTDDGDLRFAASLLNHAVFADEHDSHARSMLAEVYTRLGHGCENGTWRDFYLVGALELTSDLVPANLDTTSPEMIEALTVEQVFDSLAIRIDGPKAWKESLAVDWRLTDLNQIHRTTLSNGALIHQADPPPQPVDLTLTLTKQHLLGLLTGRPADGIEHEGDMNALRRLTAVLEDPDPAFAIVTP